MTHFFYLIVEDDVLRQPIYTIVLLKDDHAVAGPDHWPITLPIGSFIFGLPSEAFVLSARLECNCKIPTRTLE